MAGTPALSSVRPRLYAGLTGPKMALKFFGPKGPAIVEIADGRQFAKLAAVK